MAGGRRSEAARDVVAALLAVGRTVAAAAAEAGVGERTVHQWQRRADFRDAVARLRGEAIGEATGVLKAATVQAAQALTQLLEAGTPGIQLQAARSILEHAVRLRESEELERRIAELERLLEQKGAS